MSGDRPAADLVEHLRARRPAIRGSREPGIDRADLAEVVRDMIAEERRILTAGRAEDLVAAVVDEALGPRPARAAAARPAGRRR